MRGTVLDEPDPDSEVDATVGCLEQLWIVCLRASGDHDVEPGVVHTDQRNHDSLALDLLEALRPRRGTQRPSLLQARYFRATDFHENRGGSCRILARLTHDLAEQLPIYARAVAVHTETVVHLLAGSRPSKIELRTVLSRTNTSAAQTPGVRSTRRRVPTVHLSQH